MRWLLVLLVACADPADPIEGVSCEQTTALPTVAPAGELDVVLLVSDAAPMESYVDALAAKLPVLADVLASIEGGLPSLRVLAVRPDGTLSEPVDDLALPWFWCPGEPACRDRSYDGDLGDAIAALPSLAPGADPASPLLDRLDHALRDHRTLRPDAALLVVVISATDDDSGADPLAVAERVRALRPFRAGVSAIVGADTPRLQAFADAFDFAHATASIDAASWIDAFALWNTIVEPGLGGCVDSLTLAAECSAADDNGTPLPRCTMNGDLPDPASPLPCFHAEPFADPFCPFRVVVEREHAADGRPATLRCPCDELRPRW